MTPDTACHLDGTWRTGTGPELISTDPATGAVLWQGPEASPDDVAAAVASARLAAPRWAATPIGDRISLVRRFAELTERHADELAAVISAETGKPRWEAGTEVASVVAKVELSIAANDERTPVRPVEGPASLTHRPLGVMAVLGPYNFPAHLPNGQIIPALIAGNTVVHKPSELTPGVAAIHTRLLTEAGAPPGVVNVVVGGRATGEALVASAVDGVAFTGSERTGRALHRALGGRPEVLLALEMGGNNALVVGDIADDDATIDATAELIVRSAFVTSGQRCTCARRLHLPAGPLGDTVLERLVDLTDRLVVGAPDDDPTPFCGPLISVGAADTVRRAVAELTGAGAVVLTSTEPDLPGPAYVAPTVLAVDGVELPDEEVFGPVLRVSRYDDLDRAFAAAAATRYGLATSLVSRSRDEFDRFRAVARSGVVNWNLPTTGASGRLPFGGTGASGNHRPAGWTAADFCAHPVAMLTQDQPPAATGLTGLRPPPGAGAHTPS